MGHGSGLVRTTLAVIPATLHALPKLVVLKHATLCGGEVSGSNLGRATRRGRLETMMTFAHGLRSPGSITMRPFSRGAILPRLCIFGPWIQ